MTVVLTGSNVAAGVARELPGGRPINLVQLEAELERTRAAGYALDEVSFCGVSAWLVVGPGDGGR